MLMRLLGFNFSKIYIERLDSKGKNIKVNNDLNITTIDKATADFLDLEDEILAIKFNYKVNFEPNFAKIELEGNLSVSVEPKIAEEILKEWEEKKIPQNFRIRIFNIILKKSNLKAMQLEDELNIPLHVPLPTLEPPKEGLDKNHTKKKG